MKKKIAPIQKPLLLVVGLGIAVAAGCSSAYYSAWEMLGKEKRDLLRSNVESVQKDQERAADEFEDALERLRSLYKVDTGDLEKIYDKIKDDSEDAEARADDIRDRVDSIRSIAEDLFREWEQEIGEISNPTYQAKSREKLTETKQQFADLDASLARSVSSMEPVLTHLKDNVLFLKHNLNAAAIGGLQAEMAGVEADIEQLISDMRESIAEASRFLGTLPD